MLFIISSAKLEKLDKLLSPILLNAGIEVTVKHPDVFCDQPLTSQDTVLLMGAKAFSILIKAGLVKSNQKIGSSRERVYSHLGLPFLVTYDPNIVEFMPELIPDIHWDLNLAIRLEVTGSIAPVLGEYVWVDGFIEVVDWLNTIPLDEMRPLVLDLETQGLDEFHPDAKILTIQMSYKAEHSLVYRVINNKIPPSVKNQLLLFFNDPRINMVGANLKYDMRWLMVMWELEIRNNRFDTQLVGGLLNENRYNSLKKHIREYAPTLGGYENAFEAAHDKADMQKALDSDPAGFLQYAGGDTDGGFRIYTPLRKELVKDERLARFYARLLQPASLAFRRLETRGLCINKTKYLELKLIAEKEIASQTSAGLALIPNKIKYKYLDNLTLSRDVIIREFLFGPNGLNLTPKLYTDGAEKMIAQGKDPLPSCAWDHLKLFAEHHKAGPFVKILKEYHATRKTLSTYIVGFMEHLRSDGRFHPSYILAKGGQAGDEDEGGGTNTGRSSCKDPAYQTWPKRTAWAKRLRSVVIPPHGHIVAKLDYSQGELRIMADAANCKAMITAFLAGQDLHALTAAGLLGMTMQQFYALPEEEIEKQRYGAKAGNFGLIYRISPAGYQAFAASSYGVILTLEQATANHAAFFKLYPEIAKYHEFQVEIARKFGYVRNQLGRIRHLPLINSFHAENRNKQERQAINAPTQGCLFDMMMLLMVQLERYRPDIWIFGNTHDSLEMYLSEKTWESDIKEIKHYAENLPLHEFDWKPKVPFVVDFEVSPINLGEMKKYKVPA